MAYMSQEKKEIIRAELKKVIPSTWKWSLAVHHHSTIILTISAAPVDLFKIANKHKDWDGGYVQLNHYVLDKYFEGKLLETFKRIRVALDTGNWDKSDVMTDYFDVGHYVYIHIGNYKKPFQCTERNFQTATANFQRETEAQELARLKAQVARMEAEGL